MSDTPKPKDKSITTSSRPTIAKSAKPQTRRMIELAIALSESISLEEEVFFAAQLDQSIAELLDGGKAALLDSALDYLFKNQAQAFEFLLERAEFVADRYEFVHDGQNFHAQLCLISVTAWTRFGIASGDIPDAYVNQIKTALHSCIASPSAKLAVGTKLLDADELGQSFAQIRKSVQTMAMNALTQAEQPSAKKSKTTTQPLLADNRYVVFCIVVPSGSPLFSWQQWAVDHTPAVTREETLQQWRTAAAAIFEPLLPGCGLAFDLPEGYHANLRTSDRNLRPYMIRSSIHFLQSATELNPNQLRAVIAPYGDDNVATELRIGFTPKGKDDVIYGCVWPAFPDEQVLDADALPDFSLTRVLPSSEFADAPTCLMQVCQELINAGVVNIQFIHQILAPEFCDDCEAPLFPNPYGLSVHIEVPDEIDPDAQPQHYH